MQLKSLALLVAARLIFLSSSATPGVFQDLSFFGDDGKGHAMNLVGPVFAARRVAP